MKKSILAIAVAGLAVCAYAKTATLGTDSLNYVIENPINWVDGNAPEIGDDVIINKKIWGAWICGMGSTESSKTSENWNVKSFTVNESLGEVNMKFAGEFQLNRNPSPAFTVTDSVAINSNSSFINNTGHKEFVMNLGATTVSSGIKFSMVDGQEGKDSSGNVIESLFKDVNISSLDLGTNAQFVFESVNVNIGKATLANGAKISAKLASLDAANFGEITVADGASASLVLDFFDADSLTAGTYDLISLAGNGTLNVSFASDFQNISGAWNGNTYQLTVAVPEPATVAAVLGALALGLAVYRRRK